MRHPSAWETKNGLPPTPRKARTGLLTPPGITRWARPKSAPEPCGVPDAGLLTRPPPVYPDEVPGSRVPAECRRLRDPPLHDGHHHVRGFRVGGLAVDESVVLVGGREVGAGVDVRVVDGQDLEALRLVPSHRDQIPRIDVVRGPRVARMANRILRVQVVLDIAARQEQPLRRGALPGHYDPATLGRILGCRL